VATLNTYKKLFEKLDKGDLAPLYVLHGREDFILEEFLRRLRNAAVPEGVRAFNYHPLSATSVEAADLTSIVRAYPLMHSRRLVVLKQCEALDRAKEETLEAYLEKPSESTTLVLVYGTLDRRRRLARKLEKAGERIEFAPLGEAERERWLRQRLRRAGLGLDVETSAFLLESTGEGLRDLENEVVKLELAFPDGGRLKREDVASVLGEHRFKDTVWDLTETIAPGREGEGLDLLYKILERGDPPERVLGALTSHVLRLLRIRALKEEGVPETEIRKRSGVHPYYFKGTLKQALQAPAIWFRNCLDNLAWADIEMKTSGLPADYVLEIALLTAYSGHPPRWDAAV
jgi:DNA polymerase-3 subunit delta